ncbi:hypothetical protein Clacol_000835 [Clathrus columnatus]|uniref:CoA-binding domain-containing protein n=1 Tax=Clathrus columnatus TaxID=1419009 RepID=A0AAV5A0T8_9AGAM|nr:hypothetical protein Clacol_000835 [Clathrus columnatus]
MTTISQKEHLFLSSPQFAVVGASKDQSKFGTKVLKWYLDHDRNVFPIHPREESLEGLNTLKTLSDLPSPTSTSVSIITPPPVTLKLVKEAKELGIPALWLQPGAEDEEVKRYVEEAGLTDKGLSLLEAMTLTPRLLNIRRIRSKLVPVHVLKVYWVIAIWWWEYGTFVWDVAWCHWPKENALENLHILIIADPQVPRPFHGWLPTLTWFKSYIINHNLRKSWHAAKSLRPQVVLFLGDMLRHGSKASDIDELGRSRAFSARTRSHYEAVFGPANQIKTFGNYTLILLDAPALVEEDYRRHSTGHQFSEWTGISSGSIEFVNALAANRTELKTTLLFTHIPLWRSDGASCGPLREYGNIRRGVGKGYQSLLGKETSNFLLQNLDPSAIFSADDHDYCQHTHKFPMANGSTLVVPEVTLKSFSMATKLHRPGFELLTLSNEAEPSISDNLCLLPDQSHIYTRGYFLSLVATILILLYFNLRRSRTERDMLQWCSDLSPNSPKSPSPPNSPIRFKASYSNPVFRNASALYPSEPSTPLGGTPLLRPPLSPYGIEDEESSEMYIWPATPTTPGTPSKIYPRVKDNSPGKDSSYFLPSVGSQSSSRKPLWSTTQTTLTTRRPTFRSVTSTILAWIWRASLNGHRKANTWYGQFA